MSVTDPPLPSQPAASSRSPVGRRGFFITGTGTGVGKTVAAAWLLRWLDGEYWKPIQAGLDGATDTETVSWLSGLPAERFHPEAFRLTAPLSPHQAARQEGLVLRPEALQLPPPFASDRNFRPLLVEGAGGVLVPINDEGWLMIDLIRQLELPVVVVSRSTLGTINHTLLTLEALRQRQLPVAGVLLNGPPNPGNRQTIQHFGQVPILGEIPSLDPLTPESLAAVAPPWKNLEADW